MNKLEKQLKKLTKLRNKGVFISLEGGDGSGKSTQIQLLSKSLGNTPHIITFEPGATEFGKTLRNLIQHDKTNLNEKTEALLFAADRSFHVDTIIKPALNNLKTVITDRYIDSSIAYQSGGRKLQEQEIENLSLWATDHLLPDITILIKVSENTANNRIGERDKRDKIESAGREFHSRVQEAYLKRSQNNPRFLVINGDNSVEEVHQEILKKLSTKLSELILHN